MRYPVLYVDDDGDHQNVIRKIAEFVGGITVTAEPSAARALDLLASGSFDAVIAGHLMQEMDGVAFLQAVRSRFGDLPFVLLSPTFDTTMAADAVRKGATSVHFIPFPLPEFREIVRELTAAIVRRKGEMGQQRVPVTGQGMTPAAHPRKEGAVSSPAPVPEVTEPQVRELEERGGLFQALAGNMSGAVLLLDRDLRCRYASPGVQQVFGIHHTQFAGKTLEEAGLPVPHVRLWEDAVSGVFASGTSREMMVRHPLTGETAGCRLSPVQGPDGSVTRVLLLERWQGDLNTEALQRASHTMRILLTILNSDILIRIEHLRGYSHQMQTTTDPAKREDCYRTINRTADDITERFRVFCRLALESLAEHLGWIDLSDLLGRMVSPAGITLETVPPLPEVFADRKLWGVFYHLLDYSARHGGKRVRVSAKETPDGCVIRVEDNSTGIPTEQKERVFRDSRVPESELGLFIASQVLAITNIRIRETGEPGKGARFEITVPKDGYRFGTPPAQPGAPPATTGGKTE
ncbi:MAG: response regulator [Methanoregulaceae archaeon]|nr:MAG: response regulator [Methanoregulaceae archaeon]